MFWAEYNELAREERLIVTRRKGFMKFRNERGHNTSSKEWVNIMVIGSNGVKLGDSVIRRTWRKRLHKIQSSLQHQKGLVTERGKFCWS